MYTIIHSQLMQQNIAIPFKEDHLQWRLGTVVIFEAPDEGCQVGEIRALQVDKYDIEELEKAKVLRMVTEKDLKDIELIRQESERAKAKCRNQIKHFKLGMELSSCNISFDRSRMEFCFTAPERVDFRELVKELVKEFKRKIRLRQIGPRDKAQMIEGFGVCGRKYCCSGYMNKIPPVTMEAARLQNVAHKSTEKLSGGCGKLLCCLNYEVELYQELKKTLPQIGSNITLNKKEAVIVGLDVLNQKLKIHFTEGGDYQTVDLNDINQPKS